MANFLDLTTGLPALWAKIKALVPTKTSDLTNDSEFITDDDILVTVTKTVANGEITSGATKVLIGDEYKTEIIPNDGYYISEVIVTMGGVDITESVFSGVGIDEVIDDYVKESRVVELINEKLSAITNAGTQKY